MAISLIMTFSVSVFAMDMDDNKIHESKVKGYTLVYKLIDMRERMKNMDHSMHNMDMNITHHLMVYIKDNNGRNLEKAKVGYMINNPDRTKQKKMAMGMGGGFGADINLSQNGSHTIKTKVVAGSVKFTDDFTYKVK